MQSYLYITVLFCSLRAKNTTSHKASEQKRTSVVFCEAKPHERKPAKGFTPANQRHMSGQVADAVGG